MPSPWFRFWADVFILSYEDLFEYHAEWTSKLVCPCHEAWELVYLTRQPPSNDNEKDLEK